MFAARIRAHSTSAFASRDVITRSDEARAASTALA
jgi:hypothetical protein